MFLVGRNKCYGVLGVESHGEMSYPVGSRSI